MSVPSVSVVIPTLDAAGEIGDLLDILEGQSVAPREIVVVDSESEDGTLDIAKRHSLVKPIAIARKDFNHGSTRHEAFLMTEGEYVCFLTQDAVPANDHYLESIVDPMEGDPDIALVSGRQLPKPDARKFEQLVRGFNYPDEPNVRDAGDVETLGIKAFFASDACSAYRRSAYLETGGFPTVNTNEDMLMAAMLIFAGWKVAYEPSATVLHSHNLTPSEQFRRNREVGAFLEEHASDLMRADEVGEGGKLVKSVASALVSERRFGELAAFCVDCAARLAGNRAGRRYARKKMEGIR